MKKDLETQFGGIDIYLFDQIVRGRFDSVTSLLDAGCGRGRNLHFLSNHIDSVWGIDQNSSAIEECKKTNPHIAQSNLTTGTLDKLPYYDSQFDAIICSAVLHFAKNATHFKAMLHELWRVLNPEGILFTRLATTQGIEDLITPLGNDRFSLPDGSTRYLSSIEQLKEVTLQLGATLIDPIKTTNVDNLRCMTTWVLKK
ncbi:MAG: class I SAM-dependent methyltransferase [Fibrobacterales bacterium]